MPDDFEVPHPPCYGRRWTELGEADHQRFPGDFEAQVGQGAITLHSEERLAGSDRGVQMFRRLFRRQVRAVARGDDPLGVAFTEAEARYEILAGNLLEP